MNADTCADFISIYNATALLVGQAILGALVLAVILGAGGLVLTRGRRWWWTLQATTAARMAGWRQVEAGLWRSPDGTTEVSEVVEPGRWTIYRSGSFSERAYSLHNALRWAMVPAERVPQVRMVKP